MNWANPSATMSATNRSSRSTWRAVRRRTRVVTARSPRTRPRPQPRPHAAPRPAGSAAGNAGSSARRLGQLVDHVHPARVRVRGQLRLDPLLEPLDQRVVPAHAGGEDHEGLDDLPAQLVRYADHGRLGHVGVPDEHALDLERPDPVARHDDDVVVTRRRRRGSRPRPPSRRRRCSTTGRPRWNRSAVLSGASTYPVNHISGDRARSMATRPTSPTAAGSSARLFSTTACQPGMGRPIEPCLSGPMTSSCHPLTIAHAQLGLAVGVVDRGAEGLLAPRHHLGVERLPGRRRVPEPEPGRRLRLGAAQRPEHGRRGGQVGDAEVGDDPPGRLGLNPAWSRMLRRPAASGAAMP